MQMDVIIMQGDRLSMSQEQHIEQLAAAMHASLSLHLLKEPFEVILQLQVSPKFEDNA